MKKRLRSNVGVRLLALGSMVKGGEKEEARKKEEGKRKGRKEGKKERRKSKDKLISLACLSWLLPEVKRTFLWGLS
jgi:hypothetical protein